MNFSEKIFVKKNKLSMIRNHFFFFFLATASDSDSDADDGTNINIRELEHVSFD
jgi:hypothetical protein